MAHSVRWSAYTKGLFVVVGRQLCENSSHGSIMTLLLIDSSQWDVSCKATYFIFGALYPSKSGLMNKHIVKHIARFHMWFPYASVGLPCARFSPD